MCGRIRPGSRGAISGAAPANALVDIPAGAVSLGKTDASYGWDNEYGRHAAQVPAFQASRHLVSNQEFLAFVAGRRLCRRCLVGRGRTRLEGVCASARIRPSG